MGEVKGNCPACGTSSLFVAAGGYLTCGNLECPDPCLLAEFISGVKRPDVHIVEYSERGWHIEHTMRCRLDGMANCLIHRAVDRAAENGPLDALGRYEARIVSGELFLDRVRT